MSKHVYKEKVNDKFDIKQIDNVNFKNVEYDGIFKENNNKNDNNKKNISIYNLNYTYNYIIYFFFT